MNIFIFIYLNITLMVLYLYTNFNIPVFFLHMLLLSESGWSCIDRVHMTAIQTHDRMPTGFEEPGLSM